MGGPWPANASGGHLNPQTRGSRPRRPVQRPSSVTQLQIPCASIPISVSSLLWRSSPTISSTSIRSDRAGSCSATLLSIAAGTPRNPSRTAPIRLWHAFPGRRHVRPCTPGCIHPSFTLVILASGSCGCSQSLFGTVFSRHRSNRSDSTRVGVGTPDCSARRRTHASKIRRLTTIVAPRRPAATGPPRECATCVSSGLPSSRSKKRCPVFAGRRAANAPTAAVPTPPPSCTAPCGAVYGTRPIWSSPCSRLPPRAI